MEEKNIINFLSEKRIAGEVFTANPIANSAIEFAVKLGGYLGGSRRFGLQKEDSDVDVFFVSREMWETFCRFLGTFGVQISQIVPKYHYSDYKGLKKESQIGTREKFLKGQYFFGGIKFDVSCVEYILTPQQEVEMYTEKILKYELKGE